MSKISLSIIMPALNEEKNIIMAIDNTLAAIDDIGIESELIVINDGSTDKTGQLVKQKMKNDSRISTIIHDKPKGIGACFWEGVDNAKGEVVSMFPGDNENEPGGILRYLKLLDDVDMVIPFVYNKEVRTLFRNIVSYMYLAIINVTFGLFFNYTNGTILYRRSILKDLNYRENSFFFQADILVRLVKAGYLFSEVPYSLGSRKSGKSKAVSFASLLQVVKGYLKLVKNVYFTKQTANRKVRFTSDSVSKKRYE